MAIASAAFPNLTPAAPAVGLYLLVVGMASALYLAWVRRRGAAGAGQASEPASKGRSAA